MPESSPHRQITTLEYATPSKRRSQFKDDLKLTCVFIIGCQLAMVVTTEICSAKIPFAEGAGALSVTCYISGIVATIYATFIFGFLVSLLRLIKRDEGAKARMATSFCCGVILLTVFDVSMALCTNAAFAIFAIAWGLIFPWIAGAVVARS